MVSGVERKRARRPSLTHPARFLSGIGIRSCQYQAQTDKLFSIPLKGMELPWQTKD
jgi:hypothetical protein